MYLLLLSEWDPNGQCTDKSVGWSSVDDYTINITMDCANKKVQLDIKYSGYKENWFGIVFHHSMTEHPGLVYTTGKNEDRDAALYYYDMQSKSSSDIVYDSDSKLCSCSDY